MSWPEGLPCVVAADANGGMAAGFAEGRPASLAASRLYDARARPASAAG